MVGDALSRFWHSRYYKVSRIWPTTAYGRYHYL